MKIQVPKYLTFYSRAGQRAFGHALLHCTILLTCQQAAGLRASEANEMRIAGDPVVDQPSAPNSGQNNAAVHIACVQGFGVHDASIVDDDGTDYLAWPLVGSSIGWHRAVQHRRVESSSKLEDGQPPLGDMWIVEASPLVPGVVMDLGSLKASSPMTRSVGWLTAADLPSLALPSIGERQVLASTWSRLLLGPTGDLNGDIGGPEALAIGEETSSVFFYGQMGGILGGLIERAFSEGTFGGIAEMVGVGGASDLGRTARVLIDATIAAEFGKDDFTQEHIVLAPGLWIYLSQASVTAHAKGGGMLVAPVRSNGDLLFTGQFELTISVNGELRISTFEEFPGRFHFDLRGSRTVSVVESR